MKNFIFNLFVLLCLTGILTACNAVGGANQDVQTIGQDLSNTFDK